MTLQNQGTVNMFAGNCANLWSSWLTLANQNNRDTRIKNAIVSITNFMSPINIRFSNMNGDCGSFAWGSWKLKIDSSYTSQNGISYEDFVELCCSAYHETRHAEQFYRMAQGLAAGQLKFPDASEASIIQELAQLGGSSSVRAKIAAFGGGALQQNTVSRVQVVAKWLSIPQNVANHAELSKNAFNAYANLPKPTWYKRKTNLLEIEEWMRSTYKRTMGGMNEWAQSDHGPYKVYRDLPEEHDAHEIEALVATAVKNRIGHNYAANNQQPRTNTGLFGN